MGDLTNLQYLYLHENMLSGTIPAEIGDLTRLQILTLYSNALSGEIPAKLGDLTRLRKLDLSRNMLSGEIPAELGGLTNLQELYLWSNMLSGEIPAELGGLANLQYLYLWGCGLSGAIPAELGGLANLQYLYLWGCGLSGAIPAELGDLANLEGLDLSRNTLSGKIPAELGDLTSLWLLYLNDNQLSGAIPTELGDLANLEGLDLSRNILSGEIPAELGDLADLTELYLNGNTGLTGTIPPELENLADLQVFDIRNTGLCVTAGSDLHAWLATINFQGDVCGGGGGGSVGGRGGAPRTSTPSAPRDLTVVGGDGQAVLSWDAPEDDGGTAITDYEYRINQTGDWIPIGSTDTTHTVTGLVNGTVYVFEVRAVNAAGRSASTNRAEATPEAPEVFTLDFAHFANGDGLTSDLVLVNVGTQPVRPALYFYNTEGALVSAESVVEMTGDLEIAEDGGLTVQTAMEPLGELTISTHGQGELVSGSAKVVSGGPIGGVLRFDLPGIGVAGVGASPPVSDALFPVRRQEAGINTRGGGPQPGIEPGNRAVRIDARGRAARRREYPSSGQRAVVLVHRRGVPCRRYVRFRGVGALRCSRSGDVHRRGSGTGCRPPHLHHPTGASGAPRRREGGGADLRAFRQWGWHHLRSGVRESIHRAEPSRAHPLSFGHPSGPARPLLLRSGGLADGRRIGGGYHRRSGGHGGRQPEHPDGDGAAGSAHDLDPRSRGVGERIGAGGRGRAYRRGAAL